MKNFMSGIFIAIITGIFGGLILVSFFMYSSFGASVKCFVYFYGFWK
jgi:hypothetical protein